MSGPGNLSVSPDAKYNPAATDIITAAYQICAIINDEETPTDGQMRVGMSTLNSMMKELEATGIHIWTEEEAILFLQQNQVRYLLGSPDPNNPTPDHCADANDWELSTLAASAVAGATSVTLQDADGISKGDYFAIVTNNGNAFWTKVSTAPAAGVVTFADPLSIAANAGNFIFAYTTNILRPLRVPFARRLQYAMGAEQGGIITPLSPMMSRREYFDLPQPRNPGTVTQAYYNPARDQGEMYVWNAPNNAASGLRFTYYRPIHDFTSIDNTADLPQEWNNALTWCLARELAPRYSVAAVRFDRIAQMAAQKVELVMGFDREMESVRFGRSSSQTRG